MTVLLKIFGMMLIIAALASFALMAVAGVALEMARRNQDGLFGDGYRLKGRSTGDRHGRDSYGHPGPADRLG